MALHCNSWSAGFASSAVGWGPVEALEALEAVEEGDVADWAILRYDRRGV